LPEVQGAIILEKLIGFVSKEFGYGIQDFAVVLLQDFEDVLG
jgi:hypothetical protein